MTPPRVALVVTTIFEPRFLRGYLDNLARFDRVGQASIHIIADRRTPPAVAEAASAARARGFDVRCPGFDEQSAFLARLGLGGDFVPWNSDNRRNVGFLMALESGCDVLVSLDDDNFCEGESDFAGLHAAAVGGGAERACRAPGGWFNICTLLRMDTAATVFPRGFPHYARSGAGRLEPAAKPAPVRINAGLWLDDPDVDAVTRLALAPRATAFGGDSVVLAPGTWTPVNTQNTALAREAAAAYYYVRMGALRGGMAIDRYGDIFSGYLALACAFHLGHGVRVGTPIARHRRTPHDLLADLRHELGGMLLMEDFLPWLGEARLGGARYADAYAALADRIAEAAPRFAGRIWDDGGREFLADTAARMKRWLAAVAMLG